ncbi:unnamed protein product, partial [Didymodactylos carnosus]
YENYKKPRNVPAELKDLMTEEELQKAKSYAIDKMRYSEVHSFFSEIETTILLLVGVLPWLWNKCGNVLAKYDYKNYEVLQSILFICVMMIYSTVTNLPWSYYYHFVLEERHGFNKQTVPFYIKDTIKKLVVSLVLAVPIAALLINIIKIGGDYFFIYAWLFLTIISLAIAFIYPNYIAPLFDRYDPLRDGELKEKIEGLAAKIKFPLTKIYVVEGSARTAHSNAYFYGFFKAKRIVLFDTLIKGYILKSDKDKTEGDKNADTVSKSETIGNESLKESADLVQRKTGINSGDRSAEETTTSSKNTADLPKKEKGCETEEVLAVLAHEFGHWKLNHNLCNLFISFLNLFLVFAVFAALFKRSVLYRAFGFEKSHPILIGLLIILQYVLSPYFELFSFCMTALSRRFEFQADHFASKLGQVTPLCSALKKLEKDNLSYPYSDPLYAMYHYSHPILLERLKALKKSE